MLPRSAMSHTLPLAAHVVAALASFLPLAFTWEQLFERLSDSQKKAIKHPVVLSGLAFGTGHSACGDIKATVVAMVIAAVFISMYDDLSENPTNSSFFSITDMFKKKKAIDEDADDSEGYVDFVDPSSPP